jgi:hypothetical protein
VSTGDDREEGEMGDGGVGVTSVETPLLDHGTHFCAIRVTSDN